MGIYIFVHSKSILLMPEVSNIAFQKKWQYFWTPFSSRGVKILKKVFRGQFEQG